MTMALGVLEPALGAYYRNPAVRARIREYCGFEAGRAHYRGAHAAAKSGSGFRLHFTTRGGGGGRGGGRSRSLAEEWLR
jgi:hypothetical protein